MATLPPPPARKEHDYIASQLRKSYWSFPRGVAWVIVPVTSGVAYLATVDEFSFPIPIYIAVAAAILGFAVAWSLYSSIPRWNQRRREAIRTRATDDFRAKFEAAKKDFAQITAVVETFRNAIVARHYSIYVDVAAATKCCDEFRRRHLPVLFDDVPSVVVSMQQARDALLREVEADLAAITAYEPEVLDLLSYFEGRSRAGNLLDAYRAYQEASEVLDDLEERQSPFDFSRVVHQLKQRVQRCRDNVLADPRSEAIWRDIQHKDEMLREQERHNRAMEEAAEAAAESARQQAEAAQAAAESAQAHAEAAQRQADLAEERNRILRKQATAQQVTAAGTAAAAWYTRKTANVAEEIADHISSDD